MDEETRSPDDARVEAALSQLGKLSALKQGVPDYFQRLLLDPNPVLRVAALVQLLELKAIWSDQAELVLAHCHHGAVKRRAFPFFLDVHEHDLAARVSSAKSEDLDALLTERMRAELALDYARIVELDYQLFMAHGTSDYLWDAEANAEALGGWRTGVPVSVIALRARPGDKDVSLPLLNRLRAANQRELLAKVCNTFQTCGVFQAETAVFRAAILLDSGESQRAAAWLGRIPEQFPSDQLTQIVLQLKAESLDKIGEYRGAYSAFEKMNAAGRSKTVSPKTFPTEVTRHASFVVEPLPRDGREFACLTLTGFPRSATTLLGTVLEAHPQIEAFEEIPAFLKLVSYVNRHAEASGGRVTADVGIEGRERYYAEIERRSRKPEAKWWIDKLPANSAEAAFLAKVFPDMRYIFSIRHPYDVVLSCFRQSFVVNSAMENFRTIADAAALYDFVMTQWFKVHTLDDPTVCYVRYEELVERFEPTVRSVLRFIGADWSDSVLAFSDTAHSRIARTPSYQKVRGGIGIGIQSSWKNYEFLWHTRDTAVLDKWVDHLGYKPR